MTRSLQLGSFHFNASRSLLHWSMEMSSLNHTERAVMMHERKGSLGCDLYVVQKKKRRVSREIHKQNSQGKTTEVDLNKVNKGPLFQLISSTRRQTVGEMLVPRPPESGTVNALRGLITAFVCKYVFKCVCPYGRV